ncbi:MAG: hypothetical protein J4431_02280 [Candidatus Aenigmarchaeota archaeon]|nr:hypothetical protein [Candidatus Aenigmarchaeota archaeon]
MSISQLSSGLSVVRYEIERKFNEGLGEDASRQVGRIVKEHGYPDYQGLFMGRMKGRQDVFFCLGNGGNSTAIEPYEDALKQCQAENYNIARNNILSKYVKRKFDYVFGQRFEGGNLAVIGDSEDMHPVALASYDKNNGNIIMVPFGLRPENYETAECIAESLGIMPAYAIADDEGLAGQVPLSPEIENFLKGLGM